MIKTRQALGYDLEDLKRYRRQLAWRQEGQELRRRLEAAGVTQDTVAQAAGVTRSLVSHVLAGRSKSRNVAETVERLANLQWAKLQRTEGSVRIGDSP